MANFNIVFTPTFQHTDWVDNLDRVQAGGTNGFNIRFQGLLADEAALVALFSQINTALTGLSTPPPRTLRTLTLGLALLPTGDPTNPGPAGPTQNFGWAIPPSTAGPAFLPSKQTNAEGIMPVNLPDGVTIQAMRVYGKNTATSGAPGTGTLTVKLLALPANDSSSQPVIEVKGAGSSPFGVGFNASTANGVNVVKIAGFHYALIVTLSGATVGDIVQLYSVQIDYLPA